MANVEVVFAYRHQQTIKPLTIGKNCTVKQAILLSGVLDQFPEINLDNAQIGIFGKITHLEHILIDGDRIEIYRDLIIDPKQARRDRASKD